MASEKTPLLPKAPSVELDGAHMPCSLGAVSMMERPTVIKRVFTMHHVSIIVIAFKFHWPIICSALFSAFMCIVLGYPEDELFDSSYLKMFLMLIGFLLGFRNSNANQRRIEAMTNVQQLMGSIWALYIVMPGESRRKLRKYFIVAIQAVVEQLPVRSNDVSAWFSLNALKPIDRHKPVVDGKCPVVMSARALLVATLQCVEAEVHRVEDGKDQSLARNLYTHRNTLLSAYDGIAKCTLPAVSERYLAFCDMCLWFYLVAFPWGLKYFRPLHVRVAGSHYFTLHAAYIRLLGVLTVAVVLCGLEALTRENEEPLEVVYDGIGDDDDIDVKSLPDVFEQVSAGFEERYNAIQQDSDKADIEAATDRLIRVCNETTQI